MTEQNDRQRLIALACNIVGMAKIKKRLNEQLAMDLFPPDDEEIIESRDRLKDTTKEINQCIAKIRTITKTDLTDPEIYTLALLEGTVVFDVARLDSNTLFGYMGDPILTSDVIESLQRGNLRNFAEVVWIRGEYTFEASKSVPQFFGG